MYQATGADLTVSICRQPQREAELPYLVRGKGNPLQNLGFAPAEHFDLDLLILLAALERGRHLGEGPYRAPSDPENTVLLLEGRPGILGEVSGPAA